MSHEVIDLGTFEIKSGVIRLSDPCYDKDTWCSGTVKGEKGTWKATIKKSDTDDRCCELTAISSTGDFPEPQDIVWHPVNASLAVDSGQFGFFDDAHYDSEYTLSEGEADKKYKGFENSDMSEFYKLCCGLTIGPTLAGTLSTGVVSSSGYGDGIYPCFVVKNKNDNVVAIKAVFIRGDGGV